MKKTLTAAALLAALLLTGCGNSGSSTESGTTADSSSTASESDNASLSVKEKAEKVLSDIEFAGEMAEINDDNISLLGITSDGLTEYAAYILGSSAAPDVFGIFVAENEDRAAEIKDQLSTFIETRKKSFEDYTPEEMYKFDDYVIEQNGTTVYFAVTADNAAAASILK